LFDDVEALKEQVTTLSTSSLTITNEHRIDISQNRQDISSNLSKINDISNNRITAVYLNKATSLKHATLLHKIMLLMPLQPAS
jgi:hypothetical protein